MVTTVQVEDRTLMLLRKLKTALDAKSYDEAITKVVQTLKPKISMAGSLKKYMKKGETLNSILKELQDERRKDWNRI